jgi:tetratricopeptide (TPR) repeat protein
LILFAFWLPMTLVAQIHGGGGGRTGRTPNIGNTGSLPGSTPSLTPSTVFFSGKVVIDDGSEIAEPAAIQSICNGQKHTETYSDAHGGFSFEFSSRSSAANTSGGGLGEADTSLANPTAARGSQRDYRNCELEAYVPGFTSQAVELAGRSAGLANYDVGRITIHRMAQVQGFTLSATTALAPPNARKAFSKGLEKARKSQWDNAEKEFARAVELYPKFAAAWYQLGLAQAAQKGKDPRHSFEQAIAADPRYVNPYQALARLAFESKQWLEAVDFSGRLLALNPVNFPDVWLYNAAGNYFLSDFSAAETSARAGLQADPKHSVPRLEYFLGMALAARGAYPEAAQHMRQYIAHAGNPKDASEGETELQQIQQLRAKSATPQPQN